MEVESLETWECGWLSYAHWKGSTGKSVIQAFFTA